MMVESMQKKLSLTVLIYMCCYIYIGQSDEKHSNQRFVSIPNVSPEFSDGFPDNVTVQRENAAFLDCPVKNPETDLSATH